MISPEGDVAPKRRSANPKRRLAGRPEASGRAALKALAARVRYGGNPDHKRNPGDFGLSPPSRPRRDKTLCDEAGVFTRAEAEALLRLGIERGLVSVQERNGWPQNVWAVSANGLPVEAMLENPETGTYHGYPMLSGDPLRDLVIERWG
jgi:hypothetical protein